MEEIFWQHLIEFYTIKFKNYLNLLRNNKMISQTLLRAFNILKFEKNTYQEIIQDKNSLFGSGSIIFLAALVNVGLFKLYLLPNLPNEVPLIHNDFQTLK